MANQVNISVTANQSSNGLQVNDAQTDFYASTGSFAQVVVQKISGSWQQLSSSANLAYLMLFNTSTVSTVAVATNTSSLFITDYLTPQSPCLKSWGGGAVTFYASSSLTGSELQVLPIPF
jgi:hypothetical protein